jgi:hypothetical protein
MTGCGSLCLQLVSLNVYRNFTDACKNDLFTNIEYKKKLATEPCLYPLASSCDVFKHTPFFNPYAYNFSV